MKDTFGARVIARRDELGLNQTELADLLQVGASLVNNWEKDRHAPRNGQLVALAEKLKTSTDWLLTGKHPYSFG